VQAIENAKTREATADDQDAFLLFRGSLGAATAGSEAEYRRGGDRLTDEFPPGNSDGPVLLFRRRVYSAFRKARRFASSSGSRSSGRTGPDFRQLARISRGAVILDMSMKRRLP